MLSNVFSNVRESSNVSFLGKLIILSLLIGVFRNVIEKFRNVIAKFRNIWYKSRSQFLKDIINPLMEDGVIVIAHLN